MTIDRQKLLDEMQSLSRQEAETRANLMRIEGAVQMTRHLLDHLDQQESEEAGAKAPARQQLQPVPVNGQPLPPHGPANEIDADGNDGGDDFHFH